MLRWLEFFFKVSTLKASPADAPLSLTAQYTAILAYWTVGVIILIQSQSLIESVFVSAVQTGLLIFIVNVSLWIRKNPERIVQTVTAITGAGTIISIIAFPIIMLFSGAEGTTQYLYTAFWIVLVVWETVMIAHVFRFALDIPFIAAAGMAMIFLYLSATITLRLVKVLSMYTAG